MKYPIKKEFSPYSHFRVPVISPRLYGFIGGFLRAPRWLFKDEEIRTEKHVIGSFDDAKVNVLVISPKDAPQNAPCLVYYHGGAFYFGAAWYHYKMAKQYALSVGCKVVFVQYRRAPKYRYPTPCEDCYAAWVWVHDNAVRLGIDSARIGVAGDSAGGALSASVCQMARDRGVSLPIFQMLIYPVTDCKMQTESNRIYTHSPIWNSRLSKNMWRSYLPQDGSDVRYASPIDATDFVGLPDAYVEVAEVDCLRDEGINYANALSCGGANVILLQVDGAMHGFDVAKKAPTTKVMMAKRVEYMREKFKA